METELNKEKQVVQSSNTNRLLDLYCYIISSVTFIIVIIIITINDGGVIGVGSGGGGCSSNVIF